MSVQITALGPEVALIRWSIVLHRLIKGNVKNLQMSDSGPLWLCCLTADLYSEKKLKDIEIL